MPAGHDATLQMILVYRVEPGCLGPDGVDHVEAFCQFSNRTTVPESLGSIRWMFIPRYDKSLPEFEFRLKGKQLNATQCAAYLARLQLTMDDLELLMGEITAELIERFLRPV